ncbi:MAG: DUF1592 domain-containing protein [Verrucomicrobia subdivision 3 bacterium]|nr:DUF1592 domain-containing protein [Limisphaerales bacterium]
MMPLLKQYCFECHGHGKKKGDLALDAWKTETGALADRPTWQRVMNVLEGGEMPPKKKPQPSAAERQLLVKWIDAAVFKCDCDNPDPGRVTIRRLNRAEYNNTIRDLIGVDFRPAQDFPMDDSGHGFDNIGDVLSLPPILIEKYLAAAETIINTALGIGPAKPNLKRFSVDELEVGYNAKQRGDGWVALNSTEEDDLAVTETVAAPGDYIIRVRAYARQDSTNAIRLTFMLDNAPIKTVQVETNQAAPNVYEARIPVPPGKHRLRAVVRRIKDNLSEAEALRWKSGPQQKGAVYVEWLELDRPRTTAPAETRHRIISREPAPGRELDAAREILGRFARRAYRRPVTGPDIERLTGLTSSALQRGADFASALAVGLQAVLVSPHFLFRGELQPEPDNPASVHFINEYALASRLSYFLWSTMPDDELLAHAGRRTLRKNLESQVLRMLRDPKSRALVDNFAGQWLQFRNLTAIQPDERTFPKFDEPLREAMRRETELFFENIMREDRSVLDFLSADYTFVNDRLARHYGIENIEGADFQPVSLRSTPRRGVLTQASVLAVTSNPTRTSPVKRGKWVLDNLLNAPPPPPPPDVPELKEEKVLTGTLRQRMEQHREDPLCASCHARMDPIGFAFENFDGIGAWREQEGKFPIDASGELATGESFGGAAEFLDLLATQKKDQFVRCLADKMLTYALGRGLEYQDKCAVDQITKNLARQDYKFSALVLEIVKSVPFQKRRGDSRSN